MESNRTRYRVSQGARHRQAGITVIGFLILAALFGTLGLATLKIVPLYMERLRIGSVLKGLQQELATGSNNPQSIRRSLEARLNIENLSVPRSEIEVSAGGAGYIVTVNRESRAPFLADLWFVVVINEQVEIPR